MNNKNTDTLTYRHPQFFPINFILQRNSITLVKSNIRGEDKTIRLSDISPETIPVKRRSIGLMIAPVIGASVVGTIGWFIIHRANSIIILAIGVIVLLLGPGSLYGMRVRPFNGVRFVNHKKEHLFEVYQTAKGAWKYSEFINELIKRIQMQSGKSTESGH